MEENNKLIAEFMGYKLAICNNGLAWDIGKSIPSKEHLFPIQGVLHTGSELKFNTSRDWLMPVIRKILDVVDEDNIEEFYSVQNCIPNRDATYNAVVEFIKFYNQNK